MREHTHPSKSFLCHDPAPPPTAAYCAFEQRRLIIAIVITGLTMILEVAGGLLSGSLALLSDAGHMFSHLFALAVAYFAIRISCRPPTEAQSFGFYRAEILAAMVNGFSLLIVVAWILYEAWQRLINPSEVAGVQMLVVAAIGLVVNAVTALLLRTASRRDLNIRGAFIHMVGDLFSSVGVVAAAVVISITGWTAIDPIVSAGIALVILYWAAKLLWEAARILLQSTPRHISHASISQALLDEIGEIRGVHHIHVWELTTKMYVMTAHVEVNDMPLSETEAIRAKALDLLARRFGITHANLQFESKR